VARLVVSEAPREVSGLHEVFDEGRKHVVKRILAVGPVAEEMRDVGAAGLLRSAYKRWCGYARNIAFMSR
jgi:hypothetical protein